MSRKRYGEDIDQQVGRRINADFLTYIIRARYFSGRDAELPAGKTAISCSSGRKGRPSSNVIFRLWLVRVCCYGKYRSKYKNIVSG